jgi:hypothetical protein
MRKLLVALAALLYLTAAVTAQAGFLINSFISFPPAAGGGGAASVTFLQCLEDTTDQTTYTFTAQNTGTASATRYTIGVLLARDATNTFTLSTVTVAGNSATISRDSGGVGASVEAAAFVIANTSGTTATVVATYSEAITSSTLCLWQANNLASATVVAGADQLVTAPTAADVSLNVSASGIAVAGCVANAASGTTRTWTGMTERTDTVGSEQSYGAGDFTNDAVADSPLSVTITPTATASNVCLSVSYL